MAEHDPDMAGDQLNVHYPDLARASLREVIGHEPTDGLVDLAATALAALQGEQDSSGAEWRESIDIAAGTAMPDDEREVDAVVQQNAPLPALPGEASPADVLRQTLRLAASHAADQLPR
jgi:hypothetical protein